MNKGEIAISLSEANYNCAQSVLAAYAEDYGMDKSQALAAAVGFGAGMGRVQDVCGAVTGAIMVLGLRSGFKEGDGRDKINGAYDQVHRFIDEFARRQGTVKCRDLLSGCDLSTEEGKKTFREQNLRDRCRNFVRLACEILDT